ncbi:unnamed protein product [Vitrella brassicaformis CCMP3155]|uniref:Uncharacterized protein n=1 Tax=Vitrella brassicaformis (strain CCMP3155) TaxID=1169540 RepID=A0A0G4GNC0_VITBC|nr:unnamed protein product [Vitrella brassicaformis CCMP3155]|eukprot:CEM31697.1 unnamed protein product [Vitrella brassicaformis CCMP3155]
MVVGVPPSPSSIIASPPEQPHTWALRSWDSQCQQACLTQWRQGQSVQAIQHQGEVINGMAGRPICYRGEVASQQRTRLQHRDELV